MKKELVEDKSKTEISELWYSYHENKVRQFFYIDVSVAFALLQALQQLLNKHTNFLFAHHSLGRLFSTTNQENVLGLVLGGEEAKALIPRAVISPFYIQPIFRDDGHFMLVSQFFEPSHFIMAYLEDYKMDPAAAQPLLSFSVFDDYADEKDLTLIRADILNRGIDEGEGLKVVNSMIANYKDDDEYLSVRGFNSKPDSFDLDGYIAQQSTKWKAGTVENSTNKTVDVE